MSYQKSFSKRIWICSKVWINRWARFFDVLQHIEKSRGISHRKKQWASPKRKRDQATINRHAAKMKVIWKLLIGLAATFHRYCFSRSSWSGYLFLWEEIRGKYRVKSARSVILYLSHNKISQMMLTWTSPSLTGCSHTLQQEKPPTFTIRKGQEPCSAIATYCKVNEKNQLHGECSRALITQILGALWNGSWFLRFWDSRLRAGKDEYWTAIKVMCLPWIYRRQICLRFTTLVSTSILSRMTCSSQHSLGLFWRLRMAIPLRITEGWCLMGIFLLVQQLRDPIQGDSPLAIAPRVLGAKQLPAVRGAGILILILAAAAAAAAASAARHHH